MYCQTEIDFEQEAIRLIANSMMLVLCEQVALRTHGESAERACLLQRVRRVSEEATAGAKMLV